MNKGKQVDVGIVVRPGTKDQEVTIRVLARQVERLVMRCERLWRENRALRRELRNAKTATAVLLQEVGN